MSAITYGKIDQAAEDLPACVWPTNERHQVHPKELVPGDYIETKLASTLIGPVLFTRVLLNYTGGQDTWYVQIPGSYLTITLGEHQIAKLWRAGPKPHGKAWREKMQQEEQEREALRHDDGLYESGGEASRKALARIDRLRRLQEKADQLRQQKQAKERAEWEQQRENEWREKERQREQEAQRNARREKAERKNQELIAERALQAMRLLQEEDAKDAVWDYRSIHKWRGASPTRNLGLAEYRMKEPSIGNLTLWVRSNARKTPTNPSQ
jgi:hypothetical protein